MSTDGESMKRVADDASDSSIEPKRPKNVEEEAANLASVAHAGGSSESVQIKVLIPSAAVGALMGKGGEGLKQLKATSGCTIRVSSSKDIYPGTNERIGLIRGAVNQVMNVLRTISETVADKVPPGSFNMDQYDQNNMDRSKTVKLLVPPSSAGVVIGKSGSMIKEIREKTGATIQIFPKSGSVDEERVNERIISIIGKDPIEMEIATVMCMEKIAADPRHAADSDITTGGANMGQGSSSATTPSLFGDSPVTGLDPQLFSPTAGSSASSALASLYAAAAKAQQQQASSGYDSYTGIQRVAAAGGGEGVKFTGSYTPSSKPGGDFTFNPCRGVTNLETLRFLDCLQSTLRHSGFPEEAISEIMTAMQTLAKYNVMGLGLGLGVASMAGVRAAEEENGEYTRRNAPANQSTALSNGSESATVVAEQSAAVPFVSHTVAPYAATYRGLESTHEDYSNAALVARAIENATVYAKQESSNFAATIIHVKEQEDPKTLELEVPNTIVGAVLGHKAATLNEIKRFSGANVVVAKQEPGDQNRYRLVTITGDPGNIQIGRQLVERAINEEQQRRLTGTAAGSPATFSAVAPSRQNVHSATPGTGVSSWYGYGKY